jgi:diguanylate cyclase (GGDEF)-like protein
VLSNQMTPLELGDRVDVTGFPDLGDYTPTLHEAAFRRLGPGPPPVSRPVLAKEALSGDVDGDLVRIDARLIKQTTGAGQDTFFLDSGGNFFSAILQTDRADGERGLRDGSLLELTGICAITETQPLRHFRVPRAFQILLRSPKDILVLQKPSWWTTEHAVYTLVAITAIVLSALFWVIVVRRRLQSLVRQRTSELRESHQKLQVMATHDGLTQLWNRNAIVGILATALARCGREHSTLAVVMVDLDEFKAINDTYGHLAGDAVLREVSNRFQSAIRAYDSVGRYGGDELLLILPGIPIAEVKARIHQIQWCVCGAPIPAVEGGATAITCSFGVFCVDGDDPSLDYAISHADAALYRAKALGRNRIEYAKMKSAVLDQNRLVIS